MGNKQGYCITTWRLRLRCRHPEWLTVTGKLFNQIEFFYYELLLNHQELWEMSSQETLRNLEILSLPGQEKRTPEEPLPFEDVPPYFRRAAANAGIAAAKSHISREKTSYVKKASELNSAMVFYKRMYRDFTSEEITLRVWDGSDWRWLRCRLYGKDFPEDAQLMSPSVVEERDFLMLHVPVKQTTPDTSSVKERMKEGKNICGLQFTNGDTFAVGCVWNDHGEELGTRFFHGGLEYSHHYHRILRKIEKSQNSLCTSQEGQANRKYWEYLKNLSDYYAHRISREIIQFCQEHETSVIALPRYNEEYTRQVMMGTGRGSSLKLSNRIREYLQYKAWKAGIIVIEIHASGCGSACALCGGKIAVSENGKEYLCENGHQGNRYLNAARNLTAKCRAQFRKHADAEA